MYSFVCLALAGTYTKTETQVYINEAQMFIFPPFCPYMTGFEQNPISEKKKNEEIVMTHQREERQQN